MAGRLARPVLMMVTDRRRWGLAEPAAAERLVALAGAAASAGVDIIQLRERDLEAADLLRLARRVLDAIRGTAARLVVNERTDVALTAGAHGVHLRGDAVPAKRVRAIVPATFLIGRSVHSGEDAREVERAGGCDYLVCGTVFRTTSKPQARELIGLAGLAGVCRSTTRPVLAIGGVTVASAREVALAGAAGIAAIGLFDTTSRDDTVHGGRLADLSTVVHQLRAAFDAHSEVV
jgi:thiamine-phosphate pyrophosphorylase